MNVGEYVRTNKGEIGKVTSIAKDNLGFGNMEFCNTEPFVYGDIIKSSPQIIDLIEVGDYVNGDYVTKEVPKDKRKKQIIIVDSTCVEYGDLPLNNDDIETIVTHEQMEAMQYRVEE